MDLKKLTTWLLAIFALLVITIAPVSESYSAKIKGPEKVKIEDLLGNFQTSPPKPVYSEVGKATYYDFPGRGKKRELTAAHKFLPRGTVLRVEPIGPEAETYQTIEVEINDNLPDIPQNEEIVIDLTKKAAIAMSPKFVSRGKISVRITEIHE